ncbi:EDSAP-1 family PEP-CTERM protein [Propionivibrio limicola]|uniref:EDSAP-1 family PEP-CTERM protein n=1 Tax=Propionivibrio limicola TaxID=167645 RepID=UPI0014783AF8|nr:EDSAP-1 family PEP-CTERM protein [Propionivibrio limicola]
MKLNKVLTALAATGMLAGASVPVQADVLAQSVLTLENFRFINTAGGILDVSQFDALVFSDSTDISATLNGTTLDYSAGPINTFGGIDGLHQCVGTGCAALGQNNFGEISTPTVDRARGDTLLSGAPLSGTGFAFGATASTLAEAQLVNNGTGSAEDNLGLLATISFSLTQDQIVGVAFDIDQFLRALLTADSLLGSTAQARSFWSISLANAAGDTLFDWTPDGVLNTSITGGLEITDQCDMTRTLGAQLPGQTATYDCEGSAAAFTDFALLASEFYTLTIAHESTADANLLVSEPGTVALLGLSLLGLGALRRRIA